MLRFPCVTKPNAAVPCLASLTDLGLFYRTHRPGPIQDHLGGNISLAMLEDSTRIYPIACNYAKAIPSYPLVHPPAGETRYFAYHNVKDLAVGGTVVENTTCGGKFCDRQIPIGNTKDKIPCGCFHCRDKYKIIMEHSVQISCKKYVNDKDFITIPHFRSLCFDRLLFKEGTQRLFDDSLQLDDPVANLILRKHVKELVKLVNEAHGWTIVGWVRTGKVKDASEEGNRDAIDIAAEDVKPHITYLQPTDPSDVDETTVEAYKKLIITEDVFRREMIEEQKRLEEERRKRKRS